MIDRKAILAAAHREADARYGPYAQGSVLAFMTGVAAALRLVAESEQLRLTFNAELADAERDLLDRITESGLL